MNWAHMAHTIFNSRGGFIVHNSSSSIGLITYNIINISIQIGLKQWIKTHGSYYLSHIHGKRLLQQKLIFAQNDNKA